ncbi:MAG: ATP-binding protein [Actinomycetia bacterium]|nr:ATP-binding protein [Actinomycetes bacterium]
MDADGAGDEAVDGAARRARARVVILAGPSGAGKTRLAVRLQEAHGWPILRLDDFYRDHDDPALPRHETLGIADWDHVDSWDKAAALAALEDLVERGRTTTPTYDISISQRVGSSELSCRPTDLILAEGIFAAELIAPLRERGLLRAAYCVRHRPWKTFAFRLVRDLAERRKPPLVLLRRGWTLKQAEPALVKRLARLGAIPVSAREVEAALTGVPVSPDA